MIPTLEIPTLTRELICACCTQRISSGELMLLREQYALPEEPTFHVHGYCAETYIEAHEARWQKIAPDSIDAGWFLY